MIRTETEYRRTARLAAASQARLASERKKLTRAGLSSDEIRLRTDLAQGLLDDLLAELRAYERLKAGDFKDPAAFEHLGEALVGLRIAAKLTQRELARKLGVHESQVSRDERYAYQGATFERLMRVLEALGVRAQLSFAPLAPPAPPATGRKRAARRRAA